MSKIHHLTAQDNGVSICQIRFAELPNGEIDVLGILGAVEYISGTFPREKAREIYAKYRDMGWVIPSKSQPMTAQELWAHIRG